MIVCCVKARELLVPLLNRLCGGTVEMAKLMLGLWLDKVCAHWKREAIAPRCCRACCCCWLLTGYWW